MKKLVIALHGYGSNGADLLFLKNWFENIYRNQEIVFFNPNAPFRTSHFNGYQWFPIEILEEEYITNAIIDAHKIANEIIMNQILKQNISFEDIIICGFSQGAALAIHTGLRLPEKVRKIVSFSGGMANYGNIIVQDKINNSRTILFHGDKDHILPHALSFRAYKALKKNGIPVEIDIIKDMSHTIDEQIFNLLEKKCV